MADEPVREAHTPRDAITYRMTEEGPVAVPDQVITRPAEQPTPEVTGEAETPHETEAAGVPGPLAPTDEQLRGLPAAPHADSQATEAGRAEPSHPEREY